MHIKWFLISVFCTLKVLSAQQTAFVDFKTCKLDVGFNAPQGKISGKVSYQFKIVQPTDSIYLDAKSMIFNAVTLNKAATAYQNTNKHLIIYKPFKAGTTHTLTFTYTATPKKALYFIDWNYPNGNQQIWTQGQGKYTSNWLPSIDDENEKIEFDLSITFQKEYQVIANGKLKRKTTQNDVSVWHYDMAHPMSSYLVAIAIGKYTKKAVNSKKGTPLEMYIYPSDSLKFEPTYRYTKQVFDLLEAEIGVKYPWQNYKMVPVKDFLYAGMENTSLNIYSDAFVVDSTAFADRNFVNINAHELAHQWFGDLVTATSGTHHWLQEGFATYYALLAERAVFGEDYFNWQLYTYAQELLDQDNAGNSTSILNPKSSSTTFYKKGAWILHVLNGKVGRKAFREGVKNYLNAHRFENVSTIDFITEIEKASGMSLSNFQKKWIEDSKLDYDAMSAFFEPKLDTLHLHNPAHVTPLSYNTNCKETPEACKVALLKLDNPYLKAHIIRQLGSKLSKSVFLNQELKSRQAIAQTLVDVPVALKQDYESLLTDKSYSTIETALFVLWRNFPENRHFYLDATKHTQGFNNKNIRTLWLTLALLTEKYKPEYKAKFYDELLDYTSPEHDFELRQNAFNYLTEIQACNAKCKAHLKQATKHHNWRFKKFAKSLLKAVGQ